MESDWAFEYSSGHAGYRNKKTGEWLYIQEFTERISRKTEVFSVEDQQPFVDFIKNTYNCSNVTINDMGKIEINYNKSQEDLIQEIKKIATGWNAHYNFLKSLSRMMA